jgi:hypothetical protein
VLVRVREIAFVYYWRLRGASYGMKSDFVKGQMQLQADRSDWRVF